MKEFEIFIVRFRKKKGFFTTAQVSKLVKGICSAQPADTPASSGSEHAERPSRSRKKKVKVALHY